MEVSINNIDYNVISTTLVNMKVTGHLEVRNGSRQLSIASVAILRLPFHDGLACRIPRSDASPGSEAPIQLNAIVKTTICS